MRLINVLLISIIGVLIIKHFCSCHYIKLFKSFSKNINKGRLLKHINETKIVTNLKSSTNNSNPFSIKDPYTTNNNSFTIKDPYTTNNNSFTSDPYMTNNNNSFNISDPYTTNNNTNNNNSNNNTNNNNSNSNANNSPNTKENYSNTNTENTNTINMINNIHNDSIITLDTNLPDITRPKPSFDIKDISVGNKRTKYNIDNIENSNNNIELHNFDNFPNQYDIINDNAIKSVLQNINPDTFMMYEDNSFNDRYFEIENKQVTKKDSSLIDAPQIITNNNTKYKLLGVAYNEYYNQYYLLYEHIIKSNPDNNYLEDNLNNLRVQTAEYILAKINNNNKINIVHEIGQRNKINYNEVVYFSFGNFQLGPLLVRNVSN